MNRIDSVLDASLNRDYINFLKKEETESTMSYAKSIPCINVDLSPKEDNTEMHQRRYLLDRLSYSHWTKDRELEKFFGLRWDGPSTAKEAVERILAGKYTLPEDEDDEDEDGVFGISWKDPTVKKDRAGYTAAKTKMKAAFDDAQDTIKIMSPAEGLAAFKAFDEMKFH